MKKTSWLTALRWFLFLALLSGGAVREAGATDFADPADAMTYFHKQKAGDAGLPEIDGAIESATSAKPGWYGLVLKLDSGKELKVVIVPATNFFKDDKPMEATAAYPGLVTGRKIRALHDPDQDLALRTIILKDVMFVDLPLAAPAPEAAGFPLMFRPQRVDKYSDMPEDLAKKYPHHVLIMITFQPITHAAAKDGSNLKPGEGSWLDRGMKASEPGKIRFLVPEDDPNLLTHTLKVSEGPFILKVRNSGKGYLESVPLAPAHFEKE